MEPILGAVAALGAAVAIPAAIGWAIATLSNRMSLRARKLTVRIFLGSLAAAIAGLVIFANLPPPPAARGMGGIGSDARFPLRPLAVPDEWRTRASFDAAFAANTMTGFAEHSWFRLRCDDKEGCALSMRYAHDGLRVYLDTWLTTSGNATCLVSAEDTTHALCANDQGRIWRTHYTRGEWQASEPLQYAWRAPPPTFLERLTPVAGICGALFALSVVVNVVPALWFIARAFALKWLKDRAFKLVKPELEQALAYRDAYWQGELERRLADVQDSKAPIPMHRMKGLLMLVHPDKHDGSTLAKETTQWLLAMRAKAKAAA
jgi:hypothetical protein